MLVAFTFKAKPGKADEMQALLDNPGGGEHVAKEMGAKRTCSCGTRGAWCGSWSSRTEWSRCR